VVAPASGGEVAEVTADWSTVALELVDVVEADGSVVGGVVGVAVADVAGG
jgi:hypothetical protein